MQKKKIRIIVADDNYDYVRTMTDGLEKESLFDVAGVAANGEAAIKLIREKKPDVAIMDIVMPTCDGLSAMKTIKDQGEEDTRFFVVSAVGRETVTQTAFDYGAEYYFRKPVTPGQLTDKILSTIRPYDTYAMITPEPNFLRESEQVYLTGMVEKDVTNILTDLGISPSISGFRYLREGIVLLINDPKAACAFKQRVYDPVAKRWGVTESKVERCMRFAIDSCWHKGNPRSIEYYFGSRFHNDPRRPKPSEFLTVISTRLLTDYKFLLPKK